MGAKRRQILLRSLLVAVTGAVAIRACANGSLYYTAEPFSARVVDAETMQPIEGAVVVAYWDLVRGGLDGAHHAGYLEIKETVTDANGRFAFEGFTRMNPNLAELRDSDPAVLVFKGGYEAKIYHNIIQDPQNYPGSVRKAAVDGEVLKLPKLVPTRTGHQLEQLQFYSFLKIDLEHLLGDCQWPKVPKLLRAMDAEKRRLRTLYPTADIQIGIEDLADYAANTCKLTREKL
jgi:hypothetical protein